MDNKFCVCINCSQVFIGSLKNILKRRGNIFIKTIKDEDIVTYFTGGMNKTFTDPDCIIYQINSDYANSAQHITNLRKSLNFIDIPIILFAEHRYFEHAQKLLTLGAIEVLKFPNDSKKIYPLLQRVLKPVGKSKPINTQLINPFINATVNLLSTMASMKVERKELFLKKNYKLFGEISGIMNFSGNIQGSVVVCFSMDLAKEIVAKIMGCPIIDLSPVELKEGVGEIVNIISGNAKVALAETEYRHQITLPSVITGYGHEITHPENAPCIVIIFHANEKPFAVQVSMTAMDIKGTKKN